MRIGQKHPSLAISVCHQSASLVVSIGNPSDRFLLSSPIPMMNSNNLKRVNNGNPYLVCTKISSNLRMVAMGQAIQGVCWRLSLLCRLCIAQCALNRVESRNKCSPNLISRESETLPNLVPSIYKTCPFETSSSGLDLCQPQTSASACSHAVLASLSLAYTHSPPPHNSKRTLQ